MLQVITFFLPDFFTLLDTVHHIQFGEYADWMFLQMKLLPLQGATNRIDFALMHTVRNFLELSSRSHKITLSEIVRKWIFSVDFFEQCMEEIKHYYLRSIIPCRSRLCFMHSIRYFRQEGFRFSSNKEIQGWLNAGRFQHPALQVLGGLCYGDLFLDQDGQNEN